MKDGVILDRAFRHSFTLSKPSMDDHENSEVVVSLDLCKSG